MKKKINFRTGKIVDGFLYFSCSEFCGLYRLDISKRIVFFVNVFPGESIFQNNLHRKVLLFEKKLYFIPGSGGQNLHIYNCETGDLNYVSIFKKRGWEGDAFVINRSIWMIPFHVCGQYALKIDIDTLEVKEYHYFFDMVFDGEIQNERGYILKRLAIDNENLWFPINHSNEIVKLSLTNFKSTKYLVDLKDLCGIFIADNNMWITSYTDEHIYKFDLQTKMCEKCRVQGFVENKMPSNSIFEVNGNIYAIPYLSEYITKYNSHNCCFEKIMDYPQEFSFTNPDQIRFAKYDCYQNTIVCFPFNAKACLFINILEGTISSIDLADIELSEQSRLDYMKIMMNNSVCVPEDECFSVQDYITVIKSS